MYVVRMIANATIALRMTLLSCPTSLTVAQAATTLLGQIRLPSEPPAFCPAKIVIGFMFSAAAACVCMSANMMFEPRPVPVMNEPREPINTAAAG